VHANYASVISAQDLEIESVGTIHNDTNVDVYATITNPNNRWYTTFSYHFTFGSYTSPSLQSFALPGETKTIVGFSLTPPQGSGTPALVFEHINWKRISNHAILDYASWAKYRLRITTKNIVYTPPAQLSENSPLVVSRVTYTAVNKSIFDYWEVRFLIMGMRDGRPVALQRKVLSPMTSYEEKTQVVSWFGATQKFDRISIETEVDILNPDSYWSSRKGIIGVENITQ